MALPKLPSPRALKNRWRRTPPSISASAWTPLLKAQHRQWRDAIRAAKRGPRVLLAPSMGGYPHAAFLESALAVALTLRGANVEILLCDSFLSACQLTEFQHTAPERVLAAPPQPRCASCEPMGKSMFEPLGLKTHRYSQWTTAKQLADARALAQQIPIERVGEYRRHDGALDLAVGEHALAGALRYFARGDLDGEPYAEQVTRRYVEAALATVSVTENLLRQNKHSIACFNHGLYVPQGLIGEVARQRGVRVVNWNPAYRKQTFVFSHSDTYHHTMISEPTAVWENLTWSPAIEKQTLDYLASRRYGTQDWIWFHDEPAEDMQALARELGIDFTRPVIALLTSVMWDAQLHYRSNAFPNMLEWVRQTIAYFAQRPDLQLVIRIHPAEVRGGNPSRQLLAQEIQRAFPELPRNVFVLPPEHQASTYALVERCDSALIYNTKTGIEIASMGIPVVVAGEAWIRGKGFSLDAQSPQEYIEILERLPLQKRMTAAEIERARKYAFHFFFRRMIPLPFIQTGAGGKLEFKLEALTDLAPGRLNGLDVVCDGILNGTPFIYPAEYFGERVIAKQ